jgi:ATP-dependent exoDNAse (exonuclease V) beta subunit
LNASAGSGKTYQLAYKYVHDVIRRPDSYSNILAVTFTNKATEEMKNRILREIHLLASGKPSNYLRALMQETQLDEITIRQRAETVRTRILHNYSRFTVLTIDRFFQRILRAFIKELGIEQNYNIELDTEPLLDKSVNALFEKIATDKELKRWLTDYASECIADGSKWTRMRAKIYDMGKQLFNEEAREAMATAMDKGELKNFIDEVSDTYQRQKSEWQQMGTAALEHATQCGATPDDFSRGDELFNYLHKVADGDEKQPGSRTLARSEDSSLWCRKRHTDAEAQKAAELQPRLNEICTFYARHINFWHTVTLLRTQFRSFAVLSDLYATILELCNTNNILVLSETKQILSKLIDRNDAPFIYEKVGSRYDHFMIDEFQDTSVKEWSNFLPLLHNAIAQSDDTSVLLVGDIKQSIYRWRGGDWRILHSGARHDLGAESVEVETLENNYRSFPGIVEFNNKFIDCIVRTDNDIICKKLREGVQQQVLAAHTAQTLESLLTDAYASHHQNSCKQSAQEGYIRIETYPNEEQPPIIDHIKALLDAGYRPKDIVVLVRYNADGSRIAKQLLEFKQRNKEPRYRFDIMTQEALVIGQSSICSFVIATLYLTINTDNRIQRAVYNRFLQRDYDEPLPTDEQDFLRALSLQSPEEAFEQVVLRYNLAHYTQHLAYLQALHELVINFVNGRIADIPLFLAWWEETKSKHSLSIEQSESTLEILSIHKSKGLEKRVVIIPYGNWSDEIHPKSTIWASLEPLADPKYGLARGDSLSGKYPVCCTSVLNNSLLADSYYQEFVNTRIDNINLLYVALTRAIEALYIFVPQGGKGVGELITTSLTHDGEVAYLQQNGEQIDAPQGHYTATEHGEVFEFGAPPVVATSTDITEPPVILDSYTSAIPTLALRLPSARYFEEEATAELAPRNLGILMHRAFENAHDRQEIEQNIRHAVVDGALTQEAADKLSANIEQQFHDPLIGSWFDGSWELVRNEEEIIVPQRMQRDASIVRRPDRVMIRGDRAIVVDYKFGGCERQAHIRQIGDYIDLLHRIGYREVTGYLWYVQLHRIRKVDAIERTLQGV